MPDQTTPRRTEEGTVNGDAPSLGVPGAAEITPDSVIDQAQLGGPVPAPEDMAAMMQRYIDALNARDAPGATALFAPGSTVEDPVGTGVYPAAERLPELVGRIPEGSTFTLDGPIRVSHGAGAAMAFTVRLPTPEGTVTIESIDVMQFDQDAQITEMRAYHGEQNRTTR
jgi:steroid Delta-isomerase